MKKNEYEDWIEIININSNNLKKREKIFIVINYYARELRGEKHLKLLLVKNTKKTNVQNRIIGEFKC